MAAGIQDAQLKGITWDHPRGYDPLVATARAYEAAHPGVRILWEARSLQAFADFPLVELARGYDLLVIDHPHAGAVASEGCLFPLDEVAPAEALLTLARQTAGRSHDTYQYAGRQWALAIDASTQMAAYRPDRLDRVPARWEEVAELARSGAVLWPIKPVDALMSFLTLAANRGTPCANTPDRLIDAADGHAVLEAMQSVSRNVPQECVGLNPIQVLDRLSSDSRESSDGPYAYCPLLYGYANYARAGFRPNVVKFANIPALGSAGPMGSTIGGTGLALLWRLRRGDMSLALSRTSKPQCNLRPWVPHRCGGALPSLYHAKVVPLGSGRR